MIVDLHFYTDDNGLIVQKDMDGGDSAGREGDYWFGTDLIEQHLDSESFNNTLTKLEVQPGVFVRNPVHYNDPKDFSRDQTISLICAMGRMKAYSTLKLLLEKQLKNYFRYQNGDVGFFEDAGYYIRAFKAWYLYPVLLLGDTQMFINSLVRLYKGRDTNDVSDDINHTIALLQAQNTYPTPVSWLARKVYKFIKGGIQSRWNWYFRAETGANPFNELYQPLISKM